MMEDELNMILNANIRESTITITKMEDLRTGWLYRNDWIL